jgi:ABC-type Fe3+-hydroxamate transport system substrate-binding protein
MKALVAAGAIFLLVAATGCGERSEPTGPTVPLYPVTVERGGAPPLVLPKRPTHVVAVTAAAADLLSAVEGKPVQPSPSTRGADLIVTTPDAQAGSAGPTYTALDNSISDVERAFTDLGLLVDRPIAARLLVSRIESQRRLVRTHLGGTRPVTVFVDTGFFTTFSTQSLPGDIIFEAGGRNVAGRNPSPGPFDAKKLRRLNPDYYLATSASGTTLGDLKHDHRTKHLAAVRAGHFAVIPSRILKPGPQVGSALVEIARILHPHAFR